MIIAFAIIPQILGQIRLRIAVELDDAAVLERHLADAAAQRGEVTAEVTSAHALTDTQLASLKDRLTAREGRTVKLQTSVDPDLLGGLVVTIGSKRIDGSIKTRLNSLATKMMKADGVTADQKG